MFELNLIKDISILRENRRRIQRLIRAYYFLCGLVFLFFVFRVVSISEQFIGANIEDSKLRTEIQRIRLHYNIEPLENELLKSCQQLQYAQKVLSSQTHVMTKVNALGRLLPARSSVNSLQIGRLPENKLSFEVMVKSSDKHGLESIDEMISTIAKDPLFGKEVKLDSQIRVGQGEQEAQLFKISVPLTNK